MPQTPQRKNKRKEAPDSDQKLPKAKASPKRKSGAVKVGNQRHKPSNKKGTKQCKSCGENPRPQLLRSEPAELPEVQESDRRLVQEGESPE